MPQDHEHTISSQKSPLFPSCGAVALGSNLNFDGGSPQETLEKTIEILSDSALSIREVSRFFQTPAFPAGSGPDFVNACLSFETEMSAGDVLQALHEVEATFNRQREVRWAPRTLDLDLLFLGDAILPDRATLDTWMSLPAELQSQTAPQGLILPHPRLHERAFVLIPLEDVAADWEHPVTGQSVREMCRALPKYLTQDVVPLSG